MRNKGMPEKGSNKDRRELQRARPFHRAERLDSACAPWTLLLPDAAESLLSEAEQAAFDQHLAVCPECTAELAEAQCGLAWLALLKNPVPEPPTDMLSSILAQTTGLAEVGVTLPEMPPVYAGLSEAPLPEWQAVSALDTLRGWLRGDPGTWSTLLQPRLAMTGAMAFLSICLTLNLLGISVVRLDAEAHQADLTHSVSRTGASLVRSFEGLRVAYRVESRVSQMRADMNGPDASQTAH